MPEEAIPMSSPTPEHVSRKDLLRWLWPHCDHCSVAVQYPGNENTLRPGWITGEEDVERAYLTFVNGQLAAERFETSTKFGKHYTIKNAQRLGLVLHQQGMVGCFCIDLDDHTDDGGNVHLLKPLSKFLAADPVVFTSKSGKGVHAFFQLRDPVAVQEFVIWLKAWGFNREGQPEIFPKTEKLSQVYMPGLPNEEGGDTYQSGTFDSAVVKKLPKPPAVNLTSKTLSFLRGEARQPGRNNRLNTAAM